MTRSILLVVMLAIPVMGLESGKSNTESVRLEDRETAWKKPVKVDVEKDSSMNIVNRHKIPPTDDPLWESRPVEAWKKLEKKVQAKVEECAEDINEGIQIPPNRAELQLLADLVAATGLKNMMTLGNRPARNLELKYRLEAAHWLGQFRVLLTYREEGTFATDLLPNEKDARLTLHEDDLAVLKSYAEATVRQIATFFNPNDLAARSNEYKDEYAVRLKNAQLRFAHFVKIFDSCYRKPLKGLIDDFCMHASELAESIASHLEDRFKLAKAGEPEELDPLTGKFRDFSSEVKSLKHAIEHL